MRRREFIAGLGGAAAWPVVVRAQRRAVPVIGFLSAAEPRRDLLAAFHRALEEGGYVESKTCILNTAGRGLDMINCLRSPPGWSAFQLR